MAVDWLRNMSDSELVDFAEQFWVKLNAAPSSYGATAAQADDLNDAKDDFSAELTAHISAQAAAKAQTQAKDAGRGNLENKIRFIVSQAKLNGASDENLAGLGLPLDAQDAGVPATRPVCTIDTSQRLRHTLSFSDESTPDKKRKPRGVFGCEIYRKIDAVPPADIKDCVFVALDRSTPYLCEYDAPDAGKMAHYILRWRMNDDSTSPISETVSATITG
jgi:hypothetical protein